MKLRGDNIFSASFGSIGQGLGYGNLLEDVASGGASMPPYISNLELFLSPDTGVYSDAGVTLAGDGDNIYQVDDLSGTSNTAIQTTASLQPIYRTSILGEGNASFETISTDYLALTNTLAVAAGGSFTFYLSYKKSSATSTGNTYILGSAGNERIYLANNQIAAYNATPQAASASITENTNLKLLTIVVDGDTPLTTVYLNGVSQGTDPRDFTNVFNFTRVFGVGWNSAPTAINCGDTLFYTEKHDATKVAETYDWFNAKYSF